MERENMNDFNEKRSKCFNHEERHFDPVTFQPQVNVGPNTMIHCIMAQQKHINVSNPSVNQQVP